LLVLLVYFSGVSWLSVGTFWLLTDEPRLTEVNKTFMGVVQAQTA